MGDLGRHIEILLLDNDCVVVPGLGGFVAHHVSARYDERDGSFLPPSRTLGFNPRLTVNDSLLAQAYMETYDISYPEATQRISAEVEEICRQIDIEGSYELGGIGTLAPGTGDSYEFEPCEAGILTPELYGLYSLSISDLKTTHGSERYKSRATTGILAAAAAIIVFIIFVLSPATNGNETGVKMVNADWKSPLEWIADIKLSLPFAGDHKGAPLQESTTDGHEDTVTEVTVGAYPLGGRPQGYAPTVLAHPWLAGDHEGSPQTVETKTTETIEPAEETAFYTIVLACRVSVKNANAFVEQMTADGYENIVVIGEGKDLKVIYGRFETEGKAYTTLNRLHSRKPFVEAWVYKVKP